MKKIRKLIIMVVVLAMTLSMFAVSANAAGTIAYGAATVTAITNEEQVAFEKTTEYVSGFEAAMEDDFNTADAISAMFQF